MMRGVLCLATCRRTFLASFSSPKPLFRHPSPISSTAAFSSSPKSPNDDEEDDIYTGPLRVYIDDDGDFKTLKDKVDEDMTQYDTQPLSSSYQIDKYHISTPPPGLPLKVARLRDVLSHDERDERMKEEVEKVVGEDEEGSEKEKEEDEEEVEKFIQSQRFYPDRLTLWDALLKDPKDPDLAKPTKLLQRYTITKFTPHEYRHMDPAIIEALVELISIPPTSEPPPPSFENAEDPFPRKPSRKSASSDDVSAKELEDPEVSGRFDFVPDPDESVFYPENVSGKKGRALTVVHVLHCMYVAGITPAQTARILKNYGHPKKIQAYLHLFFPYYTDAVVSDCTLWLYDVIKLIKVKPDRACLSLVMAAYIRDNNPGKAIDLFEDYFLGDVEVETSESDAQQWEEWRARGTEAKSARAREIRAGKCGYFGIVNSTYLMYAQLFKALAADRRLEDARRWYVQMVRDTGARPPTQVLVQVMKLFVALGDTESAIRLFDAMKIEEYQLSIDVHNLIILACNTPKYLPFGLELIRRMKGELDPTLRPTEETYINIINACRACREYEEEARMLSEKDQLQKSDLENRHFRNRARYYSVHSFDGLGMDSMSLKEMQ